MGRPRHRPVTGPGLRPAPPPSVSGNGFASSPGSSPPWVTGRVASGDAAAPARLRPRALHGAGQGVRAPGPRCMGPGRNGRAPPGRCGRGRREPGSGPPGRGAASRARAHRASGSTSCAGAPPAHAVPAQPLGPVPRPPSPGRDRPAMHRRAAPRDVAPRASRRCHAHPIASGPTAPAVAPDDRPMTAQAHASSSAPPHQRQGSGATAADLTRDHAPRAAAPTLPACHRPRDRRPPANSGNPDDARPASRPCPVVTIRRSWPPGRREGAPRAAASRPLHGSPGAPPRAAGCRHHSAA